MKGLGSIVDLMEYQAKELFAKHGVPGDARDRRHRRAEDAEAAAEEQGGRVVVKAQVKVGGRGKAGGVKLARTRRTRSSKAGEILGMDIKGHTVHRVLIAPAADIAEEYYFSFLVDRANRNYLCIACIEGGVEIEVTATRTPTPSPRSPSTRWSASTTPRPRDRRGDPLPRPTSPTRPWRWSRSCGRSSSRRTPPSSRSTRWSSSATAPRGARRQGDPRRATPTSGTRTTRRSRTRTPTRSSSRPRRRASTTSSSTVRSASSATAPAWSCRRSTWWRTPARRTAA